MGPGNWWCSMGIFYLPRVRPIKRLGVQTIDESKLVRPPADRNDLISPDTYCTIEGSGINSVPRILRHRRLDGASVLLLIYMLPCVRRGYMCFPIT